MQLNKLVLPCVVVLLASLSSVSAHALAFDVNSLTDTRAYDDPNTINVNESRDGICADQLGHCTLRAAVEEANNLGVSVTITFSVTGTINLTTPNCALLLPDGSVLAGIDQLVTVDSSACPHPSIVFGIGSNSIIEGMVIKGGRIGIAAGSNNRIGGSTPAARNTISGNTGGIELAGDQNTVIGNDILRNVGGIQINGNDNVIGGLSSGEHNVISDNLSGIQIGNSLPQIPQNNLVIGNFIGTDATGNPLGNASDGVHIVAAQGSTIHSNTIAFNGGSGIAVIHDSGTGNKISQNEIFNNGVLGIDLFGPGGAVTPNDPGDSDVGPNNLQNFPVLTATSGTLNSLPNTTFAIEFFANSACDPLLYHGEGEFFIDSTVATTDGGGNAQFTRPAGQFITATATDPNGNTSEFSACRPITPPITCRATDSRRYAGRYRGTYSGDDHGTWSVRINSKGRIRGPGFSNDAKVSFSIQGCLRKGGGLNATASGGAAGIARWSGRIRVSSGKVSGGWVEDSTGASGRFRGKRLKSP